MACIEIVYEVRGLYFNVVPPRNVPLVVPSRLNETRHPPVFSPVMQEEYSLVKIGTS